MVFSSFLSWGLFPFCHSNFSPYLFFSALVMSAWPPAILSLSGLHGIFNLCIPYKSLSLFLPFFTQCWFVPQNTVCISYLDHCFSTLEARRSPEMTLNILMTHRALCFGLIYTFNGVNIILTFLIVFYAFVAFKVVF